MIAGLLKNIFFPLGTVAPILRGPLRGARFLVTDNSGWSPIVGGLEPACQFIYCEIISPGNIIYDLVANCGLHSMLFSKLVGPDGHVTCFEPLNDNIREIETNISLNGSNNVSIVVKAVCNHSRGIVFELGDHRKQGHISAALGDAHRTLRLESISLDEYVEAGQRAPDFIKIDVEGAEGTVLEGFTHGLSKLRPLMAIELHDPSVDISVGSQLTDNDYVLFRLDPNLHSIPKLERITKPREGWPTPGATWGFILAVPTENVDAVTSRLPLA